MRKTVRESYKRLSKAEQAKRTAMVTAVGSVVLGFSAIENALGLLYALEKGPTPGEAAKTFYIDKTFKEKIALADSAASSKLNDDELREWRRLKQRLHAAHRARNLISHLVPMITERNGTTEFSLKPAWFRPARKDTREMTREDIEEAAGELEAIRRAIWKVLGK